MPTIADYTVVRDSTFEIRTGGDIDYSTTFSISSGLSVNSRGILMYSVDPESNASSLRLRIRINGKNIQETSFTGGTFRTLHEVLTGSTLKVGSNTIDFRITSGTGDLHIGNIVVHWQRSV